MKRLASLARRYGLDVLIVLAALQAAANVAVTDDALAESGMSPWVGAPAIALVILPLLARRRFPFAAPLAVWLVAAPLALVDGQLVSGTASAFAAGMVAAFLLGNLRDPVRAWLGLAVTVGGALVVVLNDPSHDAAEAVFTPMVFAIGWIAGFALRERSAEAEAAEERAAYAEREREAAARVAVAEERARIARELHDIVAHAVSVMVLQVGAVRHRLPRELDEDREALDAVAQAGRTALGEMRHLLGAMRDSGEGIPLAPGPGLGSLDSLVAEVGRAGLSVELHIEGEPVPLPAPIDLSAYRIVQEGLTNTRKHAHASRADVVVHYEPDELQIEVRDDGEGAVAGDGLGHGLVGVRERVKIHGGEMSAGAGNGGGFVLKARLPLAGFRS